MTNEYDENRLGQVIEQALLRAGHRPGASLTGLLARDILDAGYIHGTQRTVAIGVETDRCTCGSEGLFPHEPECGLEHAGDSRFDRVAARLGYYRVSEADEDLMLWTTDAIHDAFDRGARARGEVPQHQWSDSDTAALEVIRAIRGEQQ